MTFRFIEEHRGQWPVRLLCETLEVSTAGYYAWRVRPVSAHEQRRAALVVAIRAIHAQVKARYGSPRVHAELAARGQPCCVNTVARLMQECGIAAKTARKFRCTTDSNHDLPVADNLLDRQFDPAAPNEAWVADITYIPTREGWLYRAAGTPAVRARRPGRASVGRPRGVTGHRPAAGTEEGLTGRLDRDADQLQPPRVAGPSRTPLVLSEKD